MERLNHLKTTILKKTTASTPPTANISSSVARQALMIQLAEGTNLSRQAVSLRFIGSETSLLVKYTLALLGCFLSMEYNDRSTTHIAILIPAEVKRAVMSIPLRYILFSSYRNPTTEALSHRRTSYFFQFAPNRGIFFPTMVMRKEVWLNLTQNQVLQD